ncbi:MULTISPECIES: phthiocerol/phthiodiolone dimycocerosyl transferase family protein [Tsukamurella]|uniref:Phthiocerol/phthiodiolone dimycocerosyl transferase n=2 Tax=Tsukamurella TaxID=2060 RepID=A0A5C5S5M4_9ACTN|nr:MULTISPECIES: acyltransferase [Tsukamurella]NMD58155.1 acyltransferase [Tsukamurella columbiensis]TWS30776.1 acyltransferase [Tsukamurella conjunctivitidis]
MFDSSVLRPLAESEKMFAETHNFVGLGAHLRGPVDIELLNEAFETLLEVHPVLAARIEPDGEDGFRIVADELLPAGIVLASGADEEQRFDQAQSLVRLVVDTSGEEIGATLYVHHALADGHHQFALIEELFGIYTDLVTTGDCRPGPLRPAPPPLETVLAERNVVKQRRSGLERFMPAMYAYDLPPSHRAVTGEHPDRPIRVPMAQHTFDAATTDALFALSRAERVSVNGIVSAAVLLAEWRLRGATAVPVPYIYPVDLRYVLTPAVSATGVTNPVGIATYLAEIDATTEVLTLARDIAETFRADLAEGVIQQSLLHFRPAYVGNPPGLPDMVMVTDNGVVPPVRTPPGVELSAVHGELYFQVASGIEMYTSKVFAGRLQLEYHTHGVDPARSLDVVAELLEAQVVGPKA